MPLANWLAPPTAARAHDQRETLPTRRGTERAGARSRLRVTIAAHMPIAAKRHLMQFVAVAIVVGATGCTSMRRVPNVQVPAPPQGYSHIKPGDEVYVEMADGRRGRVKVQSIDGEAIVARDGEQYRRAEMHQLKRKQFS